jgi:hypothetical protein
MAVAAGWPYCACFFGVAPLCSRRLRAYMHHAPLQAAEEEGAGGGHF